MVMQMQKKKYFNLLNLLSAETRHLNHHSSEVFLH